MKKNVLVTLLTLSVFSVLVSGCGSTETTAEQTETAGDDAAETEETEEEAAEGTETQEEGAAQDWTLEEWLDAQNFTEYTYCLWNETDHEGTVIEYGRTYDYNSDDELFVLYTPEEIDSVSGFPSEVISQNYNSQENYSSRTLDFYDTAEFNVNITSVSGTKYDCKFTLVSPETAPAKVEKEFSYYLQSGAGENLIGFNVPDNYNYNDALSSEWESELYNQAATIRITRSSDDVYDGDECSPDHVYTESKESEFFYNDVEWHVVDTESCLPVGTAETIYGPARLFVTERREIDSSTGDMIFSQIREEAYLYYPAMDAHIQIYYEPKEYYWSNLSGDETSEPPTITLEDYNYTGTIEALLEELFN
jgi:uncharacterized protein YceK